MYKVLLVDDEPAITEGLASLINWDAYGFTVAHRANNGLAGLDAVIAAQPDLVVTDIRMPEMDGLEMIKALKQAGAACHFIILSGYSEFEYAKQAMRLGVRHYVLKPVEESELESCLELVAAALDQERQYGANKGQTPVFPGQGAEGSDYEFHTNNRNGLMEELKGYIHKNFREELTLNHLAEHFFINPYYLSKFFKKKTGATFLAYLTKVRIEHAKHLLASTDMKIYEVSERVGYKDTKYFSKIFEKTVGKKPSEYRSAFS
ncbi:MAG: hypothetical protein K0R57_2969 [Paenibacillaceae bacterium]|jgi:two-component system response regulator YesN|nr:hypothetical protein [Paenibacillaceae bacterium]